MPFTSNSAEAAIGKKSSIEEKQTLRLGYREIPDELCRQGKWDEVQEILKGTREDTGATTRDKNQVRAFYEADENTFLIEGSVRLGSMENLSDCNIICANLYAETTRKIIFSW